MKILYAVQRTGNGHLARAQDLIPELQKWGEVEILASGSQSQIQLQFPIQHSFKGLSLFYDKTGALSYFKIFFKNNLLDFFRQVFTFPVKDYDIIINDFEPITAWACKLRGGNIVSLSHQSSIAFEETPKPAEINFLGKFFLNYYAPIQEKFGFHFESYHPKIFTPVIREKIRQLHPSVEDKVVVYLPAYSNENIAQVLANLPTRFKVFNKESKTAYQKGNCDFIPIDEKVFLQELRSCKGVLCGAGFELPSESLFLQKKLFVIPIKKQLEQEYNAKALEDMGVAVAHELNAEQIKNWLLDDRTIIVNYPNHNAEIIQKVLSTAMHASYKIKPYWYVHFLGKILNFGYSLR